MKVFILISQNMPTIIFYIDALILHYRRDEQKIEQSAVLISQVVQKLYVNDIWY